VPTEAQFGFVHCLIRNIEVCGLSKLIEDNDEEIKRMNG
jgi:hypothetical protein